MRTALVVLLAISLPSWWRETNSRAASMRGTRAYEKKQYAVAAKGFERAQQIAPSPQGAFNLGTAQIAAGQREQGSATLAEAIKDPALRADALFNRGNSALASKAFDHAIADYIETLKLRPKDAAAKRNLEIALARKQSAQQQSTTGEQQNRKGSNQQQQQPSPAAGEKPKGQPDLEALLRSVQQQEQEELRRMKGKAQADGRVGW